jgi:hypothetical protein
MPILLLLRVVLAGMMFAGINTALAVDNGANSTTGAVPQNVPPPVSQKRTLAPLQLSDDDRAKIRQALSSENTEVSFALKNAKAAEKFAPSVGAKLPSGLGLHPLPQPLISQLPQLKPYTYVKFKQQVLIVNPMTREIVDLFSET